MVIMVMSDIGSFHFPVLRLISGQAFQGNKAWQRERVTVIIALLELFYCSDTTHLKLLIYSYRDLKSMNLKGSVTVRG